MTVDGFVNVGVQLTMPSSVSTFWNSIQRAESGLGHVEQVDPGQSRRRPRLVYRHRVADFTRVLTALPKNGAWPDSNNWLPAIRNGR